MSFDWKGHASMFGANAMWGLLSPISKVILAGGAITPLVVTDLRIGGAMVLFWITSFFKKPEHVNHKDLMTLFFASLFAITFNQGCFIFGVSLTSPGDASIITTSMPLWAMVLAALFLKEPITGKKVLGIAFGAGGALLLILGNGQDVQISSTVNNTAIWGDLLVLFAQLCYAFYIVFYKNFVNKYSLTTIMKWMFTYSFICLLPFSTNDLMNAQWGDLHLREIGGLVFIVVGATFISYMFIVIGQKRLRPTVAGMYNYIQPIVACAVAVYLGMDSFNAIKIMAVILIFSGVYMVTSSRSRMDLEKYGNCSNK
ncbi:DMT family transporter [Parabacteroides chongii]|jgi:drug/metabolite transporter (DMT)-like permease|uniref:DMT family transporter n=1 Tax=Parabacteroides chongii TaxID=2685834 RepID=UPI00240CE795|nr:DMT family transporter [Parabacteroides chongii]WFE85798.1 DMT family transporter [Parabacteroides chongii]